jgi:Tfp pilus assembly protein PilO
VTWSSRERTLLYATVGIVAVGVAWFVLADPALARYAAARKKEQDLKTRRDKVNLGKLRRPALQDEIHDIENQITASAPETMETDYHADLKALGEKSGVTPSAVDLVRRQPLRDGFEEIILEIRMETDTAHLTDYLYWIENSPRLVRISRLDISRSGKAKAGEGALQVNMRLSTVVKSQAPASADPGKGEKKGEKK